MKDIPIERRSLSCRPSRTTRVNRVGPGLHPGRRAERIAVLDTLNGTRDTDLSEPWRSAWQWIEESWNSGTESRSNPDAAYAIRDRISQGDRSAALVSQIVDLVRPSVKATLLSKVRLSLGRPPHRPRSVGHLVAVELTSGELLYPAAIGLDSVQERDFLLELALALDAAVSLRSQHRPSARVGR